MRLKSYFAGTMQDAIEKARLELGPEAMLLNSRKLAPEKEHLGAYEVVFGITDEPLLRKPAQTTQTAPKPTAQPADLPAAFSGAMKMTPFIPPLTANEALPVNPFIPKPATPPATSPVTPKSTASLATPPVNDLAQELAEIRKQIEAVKESISSVAQTQPPLGSRRAGDADGIYSQLAAFDFSEDFIRQLMAAVDARKTPAFEAASALLTGADQYSLNSMQRAIVAELHERVQVKPEVGKLGGQRRVVMLVGPPGAGKTTTMAKLAVKMGLQRRLPVHLLSLDTMRVGGSDQLANYARIIEVGFDALYTPAALGQALEEYRTKKLILIDSPGYAPAEMEEATQIAQFLRYYPEVEIQLVLPAYLRSSALAKFSERFSIFNPEKLLFTHLDEADTAGPILEHAIRSALPISFFTDGQGIPNDLHEATKAKLTEGIFNVRAARTAA